MEKPLQLLLEMINPLSIATRGRIANTTKRTLAIATIGWITISSTPPIPPTPTPTLGGGGSYHNYEETYLKKTLKERQEKIKKNEEEWLLFTKIIFEQCL